MSINDATNVASIAAASSSSSVKKVTKTLANNIIAKTIHQLRRKPYKCYYAKSFDQLPNDDLCELSPDLIAYNSGPDNGINDISLFSYKRNQLLKEQEKNLQQQKQTTDLAPIAESTPTTTNTEELKQTEPKLLDADLKELKNPPPVEQTDSTATSERNSTTECCDSFIKAGINRWNLKHHRAYGLACSLYEYNPVTNSTVGDPIADTYAILTRRNNSILLLADGVNWGPRSRLAARCAVRAAMNHLNRNIFFSNPDLSANSCNNINLNSKYLKTHDLFKIMMRSFDAAQEFILQKKGTMTTLCCSVVCKLKDSTSSLWVVCTLSIGDSTAYVFNREKGIFELTYGARNLDNDRDMRNVGGALGHVYGNKPDVSNLNYSLMYIREKDIVFLVSDGVSDNLDPCVSQTARRKQDAENLATTVKGVNNTSQNQPNQRPYMHKNSMVSLSGFLTPTRKPLQITKDDQIINASSLPQMSPYERYVCSLSHMNEVLLRNKTLNETISAQETCAILIDHVLKLTALKRDTLESGLVEAAKLNDEDKLKFQANLRERVQKLRGKLDHASIVAYEVGDFFKIN